jgi:hypothetical protein
MRLKVVEDKLDVRIRVDIAPQTDHPYSFPSRWARYRMYSRLYSVRWCIFPVLYVKYNCGCGPRCSESMS